MKSINRTNQKIDTIYKVLEEEGIELPEPYYFVTPDGEGRYYYDSLEEAQAEHGDDLPVVRCSVEDEV